ncbi:MAG: N-acetyltransferase [Ruminococcus sp.]|nr:N-acetyltransferase [Ruminococcus sp.]
MDFIYQKNRIALYDNEKPEKMLAEVTFPSTDSDTVEINHTFVDDSLRGQGIAGKLMTAAAQELRRQEKKAVLSCSYAVKWFEKHPEYQDILK